MADTDCQKGQFYLVPYLVFGWKSDYPNGIAGKIKFIIGCLPCDDEISLRLDDNRTLRMIENSEDNSLKIG